MISGDMNIRAIAVKKGCANSAVFEAEYTVKKATPTPTAIPTAAPTAAPTNTPTETPVVTPAPGTTEAPATLPPAATETPVVTPEPGTTEAPATLPPEATETPVVMPEPGTTEAPATLPPEATETPVVTPAPGTTEAPATLPPAATGTPIPTLPPATETTPERAVLSPGIVTGRAGDTVDMPIYVYSENTVTSYRVTVDHDSEIFEYESVIPPEGIAASAVSVSASDGKVTIRYSGENLMSDELCRIKLRAKAQASGGEYGITVSDAAIKTENSQIDEIVVWDGYINLSSADTKVIADALLCDSEQNVLYDTSGISGDITAYIFIDEVYDTPADGSGMDASFILAFYDAEGALVKADITDADIVELVNEDEAITKEISIPQDAGIESFKLMVWDNTDTMTPLAEPVSVF